MDDRCVSCGTGYAPEGSHLCWLCEQKVKHGIPVPYKGAYAYKPIIADSKHEKHDHKYDKDKPRLDWVPPSLIEAVGVIRTYGTALYNDDPDGWQSVEPERYTAALMRHLCKFMRDPKSVDGESGYPHLWHMACNIAFLIELYGGAEDEV